jgi:hypothetical protein
VSGFGPIGERPIASVPAGTGVLTTFDAAAAHIRFHGSAGVLEHTGLAVRTAEFLAETLVENDPISRIAEFLSEALVENNPFLNVFEFQVEVLRTVESIRRRFIINT